MRRELRAAGKRRVGAASTDARARRARRRPGHHARRHQRRRDRRHAHRVHRTRVPIAAPPGSAIKRVALGGRPSPPKPAPERPTTPHGWRWELCRGTGPLRTPNHGSRTVKNISIKSASRQTRDLLVYRSGLFFGALGSFDRPSDTWTVRIRASGERQTRLWPDDRTRLGRRERVLAFLVRRTARHLATRAAP